MNMEEDLVRRLAGSRGQCATLPPLFYIEFMLNPVPPLIHRLIVGPFVTFGRPVLDYSRSLARACE